MEGREREALSVLLGKQIPIALQRIADDQVAVGFKALPQRVQGVVKRRKVEAQGDVAMAVFGRLSPQVRAPEDRLEFVGSPAVVVVVQQGYPAGLAKATRANQKDVAFLFEGVDKAGLIDIEAIF